jgi:hypothetical protein
MAYKASGADAGGLFARLQDLVGFEAAELCHPSQGIVEIISLRVEQVTGFQLFVLLG